MIARRWFRSRARDEAARPPGAANRSGAAVWRWLALSPARSAALSPARSAVLAAASVLGLLAVATGPASAGDAANEPHPVADLAPSGALAERQGAELAPEERVDRGKEFFEGIEHSAQSIQRQLQSARRERDVVRVLCLNDKLNQVDVALRSARDRASALNAAADRRDADRARHEFTVLHVLSDRVRALVEESTQCIGEETGFIGEAEVSVSVDPNLPDGDTGLAVGSAYELPAPDTGFDVGAAYQLPAPPNISSPIE